MRICLEGLKQLEQDIKALKRGGRISLRPTLAALADLSGELLGMKYSAEFDRDH